MRKLTIAYSVAVVWVLGWLAAIFGFLPSCFLALILAVPAFFAWRMFAVGRNVKRREYVYLAVAAALAVAGSAFVVSHWYSVGMDRIAMFERQCHSLRRQVSAMPEYENVELSYTLHKGGRVYLHGTVESKESHDELMHMIYREIRNGQSACSGSVEYPGKPTPD